MVYGHPALRVVQLNSLKLLAVAVHRRMRITTGWEAHSWHEDCQCFRPYCRSRLTLTGPEVSHETHMDAIATASEELIVHLPRDLVLLRTVGKSVALS